MTDRIKLNQHNIWDIVPEIYEYIVVQKQDGVRMFSEKPKYLKEIMRWGIDMGTYISFGSHLSVKIAVPWWKKGTDEGWANSLIERPKNG